MNVFDNVIGCICGNTGCRHAQYNYDVLFYEQGELYEVITLKACRHFCIFLLTK